MISSVVMKKLIIGLLVLVLLLAVTACPSDKAHIPIPTPELTPPPVAEETEEVNDDIVGTPGGIAYRANVHSIENMGKEYPGPPIKNTSTTLSHWFSEINVTYRHPIETRAGETRNSIFRVSREDGFHGGQLSLYATTIPTGITLTQNMSAGMIGTLAAVLVIEISPDAAPGQYSFEIGLEVNGGDYGTVPCTIEVLANTIPDNQGETSITIQPEPGSYLRNAFDEPSGVILKDIQIKTDVCDKEYFSPWYPSHTVKKGDPCLVVSGHIQNMHEENSEIAMYAEGYDISGEQVAWTLDAAHIAGQIGLHLEYEETGEFTLHLNLSENTSTIRIYANNYSAVPP
jgi:hypothetical protein